MLIAPPSSIKPVLAFCRSAGVAAVSASAALMAVPMGPERFFTSGSATANIQCAW